MKAIVIFCAFLRIPVTLLGLAIHLWTVVLQFKANGVVNAIFALFMPVLYEAFTAFGVISRFGFDNSYVQALGLWGLLAVVAYGVPLIFTVALTAE